LGRGEINDCGMKRGGAKIGLMSMRTKKQEPKKKKDRQGFEPGKMDLWNGWKV